MTALAADRALSRQARQARRARLRLPVLLLGAVLVASLALHVRDPHRGGSWGLCPFLAVTGQYCPGCGGLRAVNDLTHGDLAAAASSNLLFVASLPLVALTWARWTVDRWRGVVRHVPERRVLAWTAVFVVLAVGFAVLRNTGPGAWLGP